MLIKERIPLKKYSTINIGGDAKFLIEATSKEELKAAFLYAKERGLPYYLVGRGSNTLFDDRGFDGLVIVNRFSNIEEMPEGKFRLGSGTSLPLVSMKTATHGWGGLEWALGIPGSVGGALAMNAGASGSDISATIEEVLFLHSSGKEEWIPKSAITFDYRRTSFQSMDGIILEATFSLHLDPAARARQLALFSERRKSQPYDEPSLGCIFQNLEGISCGKLIDELGLKGKTAGGVHISPLHGNFITNPRGGTAQDVLSLITLVEHEIKKTKNLTLKREIRIVSHSI